MGTLYTTKEFWYILGVILVITEFLVPGLVVVFLGCAGILVGALIHFGFLETFYHILLTWILASLFFLWTLRNLFVGIAKGDVEVGNTSDDENEIGTRVEVLRRVTSQDDFGRIQFRESSWSAQTEGETIEEGESAVLVKRIGNTWIIRRS